MALHGSRSRVPLIAVLASAILASSAGAVAAAGTAHASIAETTPCTFRVTYQWGLFGGATNLDAHVQLHRDGVIVGGDIDAPGVSGRGGTISHDIPDGGQTETHTYTAVGYLTRPNGNLVHGSEAESDGIAKVCS
jgi:hypothetical protein